MASHPWRGSTLPHFFSCFVIVSDIVGQPRHRASILDRHYRRSHLRHPDSWKDGTAGQIIRDISTMFNPTEKTGSGSQQGKPASDELILTVFGSAPVAMSIHRWSDGTVVDLNKAFTKLTGWGLDEAFGKRMVELGAATQINGAEIRAQLELDGQVDAEEIDITSKAGEIHHVLLSMVLLEMFGEKHVVATFVDITDRKIAENSLRKSEAHIRSIVDTEPECVKLLAPDGSVLEMNPAGLRMIEAEDFADVKTQKMDRLVVKGHRKAFRELTRKVFQGESGTLEFQIVGLKGTPRWLETHASPLRDGDGEITALLGITRDTTSQKQAEAITACQNKILQMIAVGAPLTETLDTLLRLLEGFAPGMLCSILLLDANGISLRHTSAPSLPESFTNAIDGGQMGPSSGSCGTAAFRREQVVVEDIASDPLWADYRDIALEHKLRACWSTPIFDSRQRLLGTFAIYYREPCLPTEFDGRCIDLATNLAAIAINRHRSEATLRESIARTQLLVKSSDIGLWDWDLVTNEVYFSPEWKQQIGYEDNELPSQFSEWESRLHPQDAERTKAAVGEFRDGKRADYDLEFRLRHKDGSWRWILTRADLIRDAAGEPVRMMGCHIDITERKQAETVVQENEQRLRNILDTMFVFVALMNLDGKIVEVNESPLAATGLKREDVLDRTVADSYWFSYSTETQKQVTRALSRAAKGETVRDDYLIRVADGGFITIDTTFAPLRDSSGKVAQIVGSAVDITERKQAEDAVRESEERFSTIFKAAPGSMMLFSLPDGKTVDVNENFSIITGYTREEAIGKSTAELGMWADPQARETFLASVEDDGAVTNFEADLKHRSGAVRKGLVSGHLLSIQNKDYLLGVFFDITELRQAEKERQVIFEIIQGIITAPNLDEFLKLVHRLISQIVYAENCFVMLHDPADDMTHFEFWADKYDPPPPPHLARKSFSSYVLRTGQPLLLNEESTRKMQETGDAEHVGSPSPSWLGVPLRTPERTIGVLVLQHYEEHGAFSQRDLEFTASVGDQIALAIERKWAEEAVRESEERYRELVENAIDIIYTHDLQGNYTSVNRAGEEITGYTKEESLKISLADTVAPEYLETAMEMTAAKLAGKDVTAYELELIAKDGHRVAVEVNSRIIEENGVPVGVQGIARDITERRLADELITQSQQRLTLATESMGLGVWDWDLISNTLIWDKRMYEFHGIREEDFGGAYDAWLKAVHPDDSKKADDAIKAALDGSAPYHLTFRVVWPGGEIRHLEGQAIVVRANGETPVRMIGVNVDITERVLADKILRESNDKFRQLADTITDVFWMRSPDLKELYYISPAYEKIWGRSVESRYETPGDWTEFIVPEDRENAVAGLEALTRDAPTVDVGYRIMRPDGEIRWVHLRGYQVRDDAGELIRLIGIVTDITERKQLELQFLQAQKMEAVGALAGGIAHDFNNLLTVINGYSDLLGRSLPPDDARRKPVDAIQQAGERAAALTSQLLAFSRKAIVQPVAVDLNNAVRNVEKMLTRLIREDIELTLTADETISAIVVDPSQLDQILMNLAVNGRDAMPKGGKLMIQTFAAEVDRDYIRQHPYAKAGRYVVMAVTDTGGGMTPEVKERIFEPFFTTKSQGKGTGLGLATVYGIVKQAGGHIEVYSEIGTGTCFKVYFPEIAGAQADDVSGEQPGLILQGSETILVVEDEEMVRELAVETLRSCGYHTLSAANAAEAQEIAAKNGHIDLLFTDVVMPGMSGPELAAVLLATNPDLKVLYSSGYTDDAVIRHGMLEAGTSFLQKPYIAQNLATKLREIFDTKD